MVVGLLGGIAFGPGGALAGIVLGNFIGSMEVGFAGRTAPGADYNLNTTAGIKSGIIGAHGESYSNPRIWINYIKGKIK